MTGVAGVAGDAQVQGAVTSGDVKKGASVLAKDDLSEDAVASDNDKEGAPSSAARGRGRGSGAGKGRQAGAPASVKKRVRSVSLRDGKAQVEVAMVVDPCHGCGHSTAGVAKRIVTGRDEAPTYRHIACSSTSRYLERQAKTKDAEASKAAGGKKSTEHIDALKKLQATDKVGYATLLLTTIVEDASRRGAEEKEKCMMLLTKLVKYIREFKQTGALMLPRRAFIQWHKINWGMDDLEAEDEWDRALRETPASAQLEDAKHGLCLPVQDFTRFIREEGAERSRSFIDQLQVPAADRSKAERSVGARIGTEGFDKTTSRHPWQKLHPHLPAVPRAPPFRIIRTNCDNR